MRSALKEDAQNLRNECNWSSNRSIYKLVETLGGVIVKDNSIYDYAILEAPNLGDTEILFRILVRDGLGTARERVVIAEQIALLICFTNFVDVYKNKELRLRYIEAYSSTSREVLEVIRCFTKYLLVPEDELEDVISKSKEIYDKVNLRFIADYFQVTVDYISNYKYM